MKTSSVLRRLVFGVLTGALAACGGDDGPGGDPGAKFLGQWQFTSGQVGTMCQLANLAVPLAGQSMEITRATDGSLERAQAGCTLKLDASGDTARARAGQSCMVAFPLGMMQIMARIDLSSWTMTTKDGTTATIDGKGVAAAALGNLPVVCPVTEMGMLTRGSSDGGAGG